MTQLERFLDCPVQHHPLEKRALLKMPKILLCLLLGWDCFAPRNAHPESQFGELSRLATKYDTDKGPRTHDYTGLYEHFFHPTKDQVRKVCEIGVFEGASLKMFRDYFPKAVVCGIDIHDSSWLDSPTIKTFVADQADRAKLKKFIDAHGKDFDIILDDGGHTMRQQQISFGYLFKYLRPGGYYIIEDVHSCLVSGGIDYGVEADQENTTLAMIQKLMKTGKIESKYLTAEEQAYLTSQIVSFNFDTNYHDPKRSVPSMTCIFRKLEETAPRKYEITPPLTYAPDFRLKGTDGKTYSLATFKNAKAIVVIFSCNHCPVAQIYNKAMVQIQRDYGPQGAQLIVIDSNDDVTYPEDSFDAMVRHAKEKGFNFPYLRDAAQLTAKAYGANYVPSVFVFGPDRSVVYAGNMLDDTVDQCYLLDTLDNLLAGRPLGKKPETHNFNGCTIKWKH